MKQSNPWPVARMVQTPIPSITVRPFGAGGDVRLDIRTTFYLDEAAIRKVANVVSERTKNTNRVHNIRISRLDNYSFVTTSVEEVLAQQNGQKESIITISFFSVGTDELHYDITFDKKDGISGRFVGNDRDQVFLLFSDIDQFLRNYVVQKNWVTNRLWKGREIGQYILMAWVVVGMLLSFSFLQNSQDMGAIARLLDEANQSANIEAKLDAIITATRAAVVRYADFNPMWAIAKSLAIVGALVAVVAVILRVMRHLHPANVFFFGKQIDDYNKRVSLRSKLFWVVVVGFVISVTASYFLGYLPVLMKTTQEVIS